MTGMPASMIFFMSSAISTPPSILRASAPASFIIRIAASNDMRGLPEQEPKGMSTTTNARLAAFTTPLAKKIISSKVIGRVVTLPHITFEAESPTNITSIPAWSIIEAIE